MSQNSVRKHQRAAQTLKAVAHPARLQILSTLKEKGKLSVGDIQKEVGLSQSMTSQHLAVLRRAEVLGCEKKGNICLYHIVDKNIFQLLHCVEKNV
ncbi:MAG: ArsR/SmtB family transcription factor [Candidatus Omnitrophota bacterium]